MDDGDSSKNQTKIKINRLVGKIPDARDVLQSIWVRCLPIFSLYQDREFMESKRDFVFSIGVLFWTILLLSKGIQ
jgi:hypothetical protein